MSESIRMPALSPTMEIGTLLKWHVKEGDKIAPGDLIAEIETDKATMEFEAVDEGIISKIVIPEGTHDVKVNEIIAEISTDDEANAVGEQENVNRGLSLNKNSQVIDKNRIIQNVEKRIKISPLAKNIAKSHNIDLTLISGSGPNGRIVKADILNFIKSKPLDSSPEEDFKSARPPKSRTPSDTQTIPLNEIERLYHNRSYEIIELTSIRKSIAKKLVESKQTTPHFYLRRSINVDKLLKIRKELNDELEKEDIRISINDFVIKACAKALRDNPDCNSVWADDKILKLNQVDISVAVAIDQGLITPVIHDVDLKNLTEISIKMKELSKKAHSKKLQPSEYLGGGFSISNLGMMGVENFDAIINSPQASILAVGTTVKKPIVDHIGNISIANMLSVTLSVDHRVIDGATGAIFLDSIVKNLTNPFNLLL